MRVAERNIELTEGEFPYGLPPPNEVALASGALRILARFAAAIEDGQACQPVATNAEDLLAAQQIAQLRFSRAILGSMRVAEPPGRSNSELDYAWDDPESTAGAGALGEAREIHIQTMYAYDSHAEKAPFSITHEKLLEAALLHMAGAAETQWEVLEARDVAASRGYIGLFEFVDMPIPDTPATIEQYAGVA